MDTRPATKRFGTRYPWDLWLSGRPVVLTRGVDFDIEPHSLAQIAMRTARAVGLKGRRTVKVEGNTVRIGPKEPRRAKARASNGRPGPQT